MKRTKNYVNYKKVYLKDLYGSKYAPYNSEVSLNTYDPDLDSKIEELAKRNTGEPLDSGYGFGARDLSFEFFTEKGMKVFHKKLIERYKKNIKTITAGEAEIQYTTREIY